jgi:hypothetical protein
VGTRLWRSGIEVRGIPIAFGAALLVFGGVAQDTKAQRAWSNSAWTR